MNAPRRSQAGYSLAEMLTVVAIVGVLAMVTVPSFITYYNSNRMKATMRTLTTDLRTARGIAITKGHIVKVSYTPGANSRDYAIFEGDRASGTVPDANWIPLTGAGSNPPKPAKALDAIAYFPVDSPTTPQTFKDESVAADTSLDILFFPDGHVRMPNNATSASMTLKTDRKVPKASYTILISPTGRVLAQ